jgi:U3 small nucleolar RNA-associated protein 12
MTDRSLPSSSTAPAANLMLTVSKDSFMKLWDLSTQHCIQTIVAHRSEIWSMDVDREQNFVLTGSGEGGLKAWKIDNESLAEGLKETGSGEVIIISGQFKSGLIIARFIGHKNDPPSG